MAKTTPHDWSEFTLRIAIKAPPAKVFRAWTHARTVSAWFTEKTEMGNASRLLTGLDIFHGQS